MEQDLHKKWCIIAEYRTGDSYRSYDTKSSVDITWNKKEIARENLKRIKEHNEYVKAVKDVRKNKNSVLKLIEEAKKKPWFISNDSHGYPSHSLNLISDDGSAFRYYAPWFGYF